MPNNNETYQKILESIRTCSGSQGVCLVAVSKRQTLERVVSLIKAGHRDFGENYSQELISKAEELKKLGYVDLKWHFIGNLQRNKVKSLLPYISHFHALDSIKLAKEISKRHGELGIDLPLECFVQVNIDQEESKSGMDESEVARLIQEVSSLRGIKISGLMAIGSPHISDPRLAFRKMKKLSNKLEIETGLKLKLSMGMSKDYLAAIEEGANVIRVGTALFGDRAS